MDERFINLPHLVLGDVVMCLNKRISDCLRNIELSPNEELEEFYREALVAYRVAKRDIIDMFGERQMEA